MHATFVADKIWGDKLEAARTRLMFTSSCTPGTGILFPAIAAYQNDIPGNTRNSRFFQGMENLLRPENKFNLSVYLTDPFLPPSPMAEASRCCCKLTEKQTNRETDSEEIFGFGLLYFFLAADRTKPIDSFGEKSDNRSSDIFMFGCSQLWVGVS